MAWRRCNPDQKGAILSEVERRSDRQALFRERGIGDQTFYRGKRRYGVLEVPDVQRIQALEEENRKLI